MIDYEKLQKIHELAKKYTDFTNLPIQVIMYFSPRNEEFILVEPYNEDKGQWEELARGYDDAINKLNEVAFKIYEFTSLNIVETGFYSEEYLTNASLFINHCFVVFNNILRAVEDHYCLLI